MRFGYTSLYVKDVDEAISPYEEAFVHESGRESSFDLTDC